MRYRNLALVLGAALALGSVTTARADDDENAPCKKSYGGNGTVTVDGVRYTCKKGKVTDFTPVHKDAIHRSEPESTTPGSGDAKKDAQHKKEVAQFKKCIDENEDDVGRCESLRPASKTADRNERRKRPYIKNEVNAEGGDAKAEGGKGEGGDAKGGDSSSESSSDSSSSSSSSSSSGAGIALDISVEPFGGRALIAAEALNALKNIGLSLVAEFQYVGRISGPEARYTAMRGMPGGPPISYGELINDDHQIGGGVGLCFMPWYIGACATFGALGTVSNQRNITQFKLDAVIAAGIPYTPLVIMSGYSLLRRAQDFAVHTAVIPTAEEMMKMGYVPDQDRNMATANTHGGLLRLGFSPLPRTFFFLEYRGYKVDENDHDGQLRRDGNGTVNHYGVGMSVYL